MIEYASKIVLIGGSGITDSPLFHDTEWKVFETGYSNGLGDGVVEYQESNGVIFIPRHGHEKRYGPSCTQYGANLIAARKLGARIVIATSAVGSLRDDIEVESLVIPDDYKDETERNDNLFGVGIVVHANPIPAFSEKLREILYNCANEGNVGYKFNGIHFGGTCVVIPGDRFGTKAEGRVRAQYAETVGMTICPSASMAMQLGMHYAVAAFPVDKNLDASHEHGTLEVMGRLSAIERVPAYIANVVERAREFTENPDVLPQLMGNIIPGDTSRIKNIFLREIAEELLEVYCQIKRTKK